MARIIVSKEARKDILSIRQYIRDELSNPSAAKRIVDELKKRIRGLEAFPERGSSVDALISVQTEYRYLVCENYCIFYLYSQKEVLIVRILHKRQDCLRALFMLN